MDFFVDLTSVGTFFAFILVCAGVLYMDHSGISRQSKFRVPYINGKYLISLGLIIAVLWVYYGEPELIAVWRQLSITEIIAHKLLIIIFWLVWAVLSVMGFKFNFSLFPVAGILFNLYLMSQLGASNWMIFLVWLAMGLLVYFGYGYRHSVLNQTRG